MSALDRHERIAQARRRDNGVLSAEEWMRSYAVGAATVAARAAGERGRVATALRLTVASRLRIARIYARAAGRPHREVRDLYYDALVWALTA